MQNKNIGQQSLEKHSEWRGKMRFIPSIQVKTREDLSLAYTPGVAQPCLEIQKDETKSYDLTRRWNEIAVVTDGTAVLGLGDIGPAAGMPVMEGKCLLFSQFAGIDAVPLCIDSKDPDEIVRTVYLLQKNFGGINLEDISAPRCFEIEKRLKEICEIPVFHDDQHGTAVVVLAALTNALKLAGKTIEDIKIVISGSGAAGSAIGKLLMSAGAKNVIFCNRHGAISLKCENLTPANEELARISNPEQITGTLAEAMVGSDVFIGVSAAGLVSKEMVKSMADKAIVFAMANPVPEIMPQDAEEAGAYVVGSGRSDFKNQINNLLAFPGIFRGALDCRSKDINEEMKLAAAMALARLAPQPLNKDSVIPDVFDERVVKEVAKAVSEAARKTGVARI
ncbi:MAG: NADP-dependent malic enzyme [Clostridiales bacterium]|nr:NADP-dependent malic enzyme [Clostridiales bacterium]